MAERITRAFLQRRYWIATGTILFALAVTVIFGALHLKSLQNNARYSAAFVSLTEAANDVEVQLHLMESTSNSEHQGIHSHTSQDEVAQTLRNAIVELASVYTALRKSGPKANDDVSGSGDTDTFIEDLALEVAFLETRFMLSPRAMPFEMARVWEGKDVHEHPGADIENQSPSASGRQGLEDDIAEFLSIAMWVSSTWAVTGVVDFAGIAEASAHFRSAVRPGFSDLTGAIRGAADRKVHSALLVVGLGATFCALAALANAVFLFRPMARAVLDQQIELENERDRALASSQAKKDFLAVMSHELRTPMNGVLGFANLILRTDLTPDQREYIQMIIGSGESLLELLNAVLDISKIEAGSLVAEPHRFSIHETTDSAVQLLAAQALEKRLELTHVVDANLPNEVYADSGLIRKLVLNLVGNAIKFTDQGGVAIEVREAVTTGTGNLAIEIAVSDTGAGVPKDKQELIFDRFAQADGSTRRVHEGTGLGLAICKEIAEIMGGRIWVESTVGVGSTFYAELQLEHVEPSAPSLREVSGQDLTGVGILVVDDNPVNCRIAELQLAGYGARTKSVRSCEEALGVLASAHSSGDPFMVCVIDQMMPVTDGVALMRMIRTDQRFDRLKTIISSSAGVRTDTDARELGFDAAVPKPVSQVRLVQSIGKLLASASREDVESELDERFAMAEKQPIVRPGSDRHVLIVEDNNANLKLACLILQNAGYTFDKAVNGVEAVAAATNFTYNAILMDIRMPIMDGIEATKRIRQLPGGRGKTPIIAMTANIAEHGEDSLLDIGIVAVIPKPVDETKLVSVLAGVVAAQDDAAA